MAGRGNDRILWSISLEGSEDVAKKLKAAGDAGEASGRRLKQAFSEAGGSSGSGLGKFSAEAEEGEGGAHRLREALHVLHPVLEEAGLGLGNLGAFARLAGAGFGALGAAVLGSLVVGLAKVGEESDKARARLKALGAEGAFEKLEEQAKALGLSTEDLQPGLESLQRYNQSVAANNPNIIHPQGHLPGEAEEAAARVRIINGSNGSETGGRIPTDLFLNAQKTLLEATRVDQKDPAVAKQAVKSFIDDVLQNRALTPKAVDDLSKVSPTAGNVLAKSLSNLLGGNVADPEELKARLDRGQRAPVRDVFSGLEKEGPQVHQQSEAAKGVIEAFEHLEAVTKRLAESLSGDVGLAGAIEKLAEFIEKQIHPRDFEPGGPKFIGPVSEGEKKEFNKPDIVDVGKALVTGKSEERFNDSAAIKVAKFLREGPKFLQKTPAEEAQRIIGGGASSSGTSFAESPVLKKLQQREIELQRARDGQAAPSTQPEAPAPEQPALPVPTPAVAAPPTAPAETAPEPSLGPSIGGFREIQPNPYSRGTGETETPVTGHYDESQRFIPDKKPRRRDRRSELEPEVPTPLADAERPQQVASLTTVIQDALRGIAQGVTEKANSLAPAPDTKVQGPVDGLGVRGEGPQDAASKSVAELDGAAGQATEGLKQLASAAVDAASGAKSKPVQAAAAGGLIRHLDDGGHVRGPGTSTSDSIPAMLSDGEYVVKAASVKKLGVDKLHAINDHPEHFAGGGLTKSTAQISPQNSSDLRGNFSITYDPNTGGAYINGNLHVPGDPLLEVPPIKAAVERSKADMNVSNKAKTGDNAAFSSGSDGSFTGNFGGGEGFAKGGYVGERSPAISEPARTTINQTFGRMFPHLANGGLANSIHAAVSDYGDSISASLPDVSSAGPKSMKLETDKQGDGPLHPVTLNLPGGGSVGGMFAKPDAVDQLSRAAVDAKTFSVYRSGAPSWDR
jgi:hypothetical protein